MRAWRGRVPWLVAALPFVTYLPVVLSVPLEPDEGVYATVAQGLLSGSLPYEDVFDHKPPLIYAWYALAFVLFGEHDHAPRLLAAIVLAGTSAGLVWAGTALYGRRVGLAAALMFGVAVGAPVLRVLANTEVFTLLPLTLAFAAALRSLRDPALRSAAAAGALAALAVLTKPTVVLAVAVLVLGPALAGHGRRRAGLAAFAGGGAAVLVLVLGPLALTGALDDFLYANVSYQRLYAAQPDVPRSEYWARTAPAVFTGLAPLLVLGAAGLLLSVRRVLQPERALFLAWSVGLAFSLFLTGRYYAHYTALILPPLALAAGYALALLVEPRRLRAPALACAGGLLVAGISLNIAVQPDASTVGAERRAEDLGRYVGSLTEPGDRIWEYGRLSTPYFYADRPPGSRFIYDRPFWLEPPTLRTAVRELWARLPEVILDTRPQQGPSPGHGVVVEVGGFYYPTGLGELLRSRYELHRVFEGFAVVYRLRSPPAA